MSNSLVKLVDYALLPAIILLLGKIAGVYLTVIIFDINIGFIQQPSSLLSLTPVVSNEFVQLVSSYSDLFMFVLIGVGFSYVLASALYFHDTHIKTSTINVLAKYNLLSLIKSSYHLYHAGIIWLAFTWIADLVVLVDVLLNKTYAWIFIITTLFTLSLSVILFRDLFRELDLQKRKYLRGEI
jgi:hypothetical protein